MSYARLQMYRPLISNRITQRFDESKACEIVKTGRIIGKAADAQCPSGSRNFYHAIGMKNHNGWDYALWTGEPIYHNAIFDGWLHMETDWAGGKGADVVSNEPLFFLWHQIPDELKTVLPEHYQNGRKGFLSHVKTRNWHLHDFVGHEGKTIHFGETVGLGGNTGKSSGPHLHYGWKLVDESGETYLNGRYVHKGKFLPHNGFYGALDPAPYMDNSIDAKTKAEYLRIPPPPLSDDERKDMNSQLSAARRLLFSLRELLNKV